MDDSTSRKKDWELTQEAFETFLAHLDSDRERASEKFEVLRLKLVRFFEWRSCPYPEDHAWETIIRVCRRLGEGEVIKDVTNYAYGVARLLFLEILKTLEKERAALERLPPRAESDGESQQQSLSDCFESCLGELSSEDRDLITRYYQGEKHAKIENRRRLAEELGILLNALRIRAHRIRGRLERCISKCLEQSPE